MPLTGHLARLNTVNHIKLPRLPVPQLQNTLQRYLYAVRPLASAEEYAQQQEMVQQFENGIGKTLHESLVAREAERVERGGYPYFHFEEEWDAAYLEARCPSTVNINPFYLIEKPKGVEDHPVALTAAFIHSSAQWLIAARAGDVAEDGGDLSQIPLFFGFHRTPKKGRCEADFHGATSRHIVVQSGGEFYKVEVITEAGEAVPFAQLAQQFSDIYAAAKEAAARGQPGGGVGALTSENRDKWAEVRARLQSLSPSNAESLKAIEEAVILVALDLGDAGRDEGLVGQCKSALHGNTSAPTDTLCNRYFDKHQLLADEGGLFGFNFEHAASDGAGWNKTIQEVFGLMQKNVAQYTRPAGGSSAGAAPLHLPFELDDGMRAEVASARQHVHSTFEQGLDLGVLNFDTFGKDEIKKWGLSPDGVLQMVYQASYQQLHQKPAPTYEACAMRSFFHGRTETIRSCHPEANAFARAFNEKGTSDAELKALLQTAVKAQSAQAKLAASGEGIDRHFLSLKTEAKAAGVDLDKIPLFSNSLFKHSGDWILSTSNVTMPFVKFFGFGAVTTNGYGLGYMTFKDNVPLCLTSFTADETSTRDMRDAIDANLKRVHKLFL
eukprot:TRINITY_DN21504_c0_g5_i1.p2 TRINITY_DN21504_c0_g5~~TRINITY_DN21504_c0_g5_i1.p2  ORF type:complete len:609 (+),score=285.72 TRINITY_DN21504_c0_g5_i1:135-1961(+)